MLADQLKALGVEAHHLPRVDSTNDELKRRLRAGELPDPTLLHADEQYAGRGTLGRQWVMQPGRDIAMSLALPMERPGLSDARLPLCVGAAVALALEGATGIQLGLRWPNDLLGSTAAGRRKLGGVLTETVQAGVVGAAFMRPDDAPAGERAAQVRPLRAVSSAGAGARWVVIGVGLNVNSLSSDFPAELALAITTLREALAHARGVDAADVHLPREAVLAAVAVGLCAALAGGLDADRWLREWPPRDQTPGTRFLLDAAGKQRAVVACGVDFATGRLVCTDAEGNEHQVEAYTALHALP